MRFAKLLMFMLLVGTLAWSEASAAGLEFDIAQFWR